MSDDDTAMQPAEFNERLEELIDAAERSGLHPAHIENGLFDKANEVASGRGGDN